MPVRSGPSYWMTLSDPPREFRSLPGDLICEVVIIGGGITGSLVAHQLAAEGVQTVLIDKRVPGVGSTAASTGLLEYAVDVPLSELSRKIGSEAANHAYRRGLKAIDELEALIADQHLECGFSRRQTLYFASHFWHASALLREFEARRTAGFPVRLLNRQQLAEISTISASAALLGDGDAQVDPYQLTQQLLLKTLSKGLQVYAHTDVLEVRKNYTGAIIKTDRGTILAKKVIFATGYESARFLDRPVGRLLTTYALVSEPLTSSEGWPEESLLWETARPYFYARRTDDGRAMIGGQDTPFKNDHRNPRLMEKQFVRLQRRFRRLFPKIDFEPAFGWAGTFGETNDGLPFIGSPSSQPHSYFALGYGGNGITFSMIAARLIADLYLGRANPDAPYFSFARRKK